MTQKEIIDIEQENSGHINLYLEGTFFKAYEQSAFAFCTRIKAYNVLPKESDPYVLLSVRNAREGFLKHFGE